MGSRKRRDSFTVISNIPLRDPDLSLKAKGLFCVIRSLPDDWEYSLRGLSHICVEGIDAIREGVKELERAGYLHRERSRRLHRGCGWIINTAILYADNFCCHYLLKHSMALPNM